MLRPSGFVCFAALALVASDRVTAQTATSEPPPRLKLAPTLEPPPLQSSPAIAMPTEREAIFLRADRLEGIGEKWIEAAGKVELRTRRQTVLADWLRYDVESDEMWGKGNVTIRRGIDVITGPEAKFKRDTEVGFFTAPEFSVGENASRGSAGEILFNGPDRYQVKDATTRPASRQRRLVPAWPFWTSMVASRRHRRCDDRLQGRAIFLAMASFPCRTNKSGSSLRSSARHRAAASKCLCRTTSTSRRTTTRR
jgi:lipopolysaccharide assembly outer membrane protein LptD (OstA)